MKRRNVVAYVLLSLAMLLPLAPPAAAATIAVQAGTLELPGVNLCTALGGNVDSTNTIDRGNMRGPVLLRIANTGGGSPTVTINILGSMDNTNFFNVAYATVAAPETVAVAAVVVTTTATNYYILRPFHPWRYLKVAFSANTNETLTVDAWASLND
jgi:hypothetical protein